MLRSSSSGLRGGEDGAPDARSRSPDSLVEFVPWEEYVKSREENQKRRGAQEKDDDGAQTTTTTTQCEPCVCTCPSPDGGNATASGGEAAERLKLRFLTTERSFARLAVMLEQIAEDYERRLGSAAPRITVTGVPTLAEMEREVRFDVTTRAGQFDGYIITPLWIGELADGLFELTDFIKDYSTENPDYWTDILLFYREVISSYDNKLFLFPFDGDVISMFYRRDLLDEHGKDVPKTWDEYNDLARYFHGMVDTITETDPETGNEVSRNVTLAGSCIGRTPACGNPYWAQTVLATMTQVRGTYEGSLLDSRDMSPLLGPAMEETLRLLGEQTELGAPDEFDGCVGVHVEAMNAGRCVLTYNWGNSFSDHVRPGSTVRGKLGVAPIPGSERVLNRRTGELELCTPESCPHAVLDGRTGRYINQAPYGAYGGFSGAVSASVSPEHQRAAAEFFAFATSSKKAIKYVIPDANNPDANPVPTGMDPYARSMLVVEEWTSRGFDQRSVEEYKFAIESQLGSENVVMDVRFPRAADFMAALDDETTWYTNATKHGVLGTDAEGARRVASQRIARRWDGIVSDFDSDEGRSPGALLEMYQHARGVYVEDDVSSGRDGGGGNSLSGGAIAGIAVGVALGVGLLAALFAWHVTRSERRKREEAWYINPSDITDTKELLGRGSFGVVTKGFLRGTPVALKHPLGWQPPAAQDKNREQKEGSEEEGKTTSPPYPSAPEGSMDNESGDGGSVSDGVRPSLVGRRTSDLSGTYGSRPGSVSSIEINPIDATVGASMLTDTFTQHTSPFSIKKKKDKDPLRAELLTLIKLRHDNIVQTLGATIFDTRKKELVLVLQYMQNNTVRSLLKDPNGVAGTAGMALEMQWALQVARGCGYLHSVPPPAGPMLHNDLKSSNVLVDGSYNAHISDFGLATKTMGGLWGAIRSSAVARSGSNNPKGSLLWMAPEVLNGAEPTPASDVYSYSMFLVELMTRGRPYGIKAYKAGVGSRRFSEVSVGTEYDKRRMSEDNPSPIAEELDEDPNNKKASGGRGARRRVSWSSAIEDEKTEPTAASISDGQNGGGASSVVTPRAGSGMSSNRREVYAAKPSNSKEFYAAIGGEMLTRDDIIDRVKNLNLDPPFRPTLPDNAPRVLRDICIECWHKNPKRRPTFKEVEDRLNEAVSNENLTQQMMRRGSMFDTILPRDVQDKLARGEAVPPKSYQDATVIFSDIVGFTNISSALTAEETGDLIFRLFSKFDALCKTNGVKKLDVIGDAFLGVVGVPVPASDGDHAGRAARFALDAIAQAGETLICPSKPDLGCVRVRFGLASGSVVATVIGSLEHPKYTLFGDTVNTASRMESSSMPGRCQCTAETARLLNERSPDIEVTSRGTMKIKGKGEMETFWLEAVKPTKISESSS